jgi:exodeoxyribonuclease V alpha subunit
MVLTPEQEAAIYNALHEPISIITGGPGTGKTTIIRTLATLVTSKNISACAPAGRAAFRIQEAAGVEADTIHQLIMLFPGGGRFPQYRFSMSPLIKTSFLVVDECSMIDIWLLRKLLKECSARTHIVFLGDVDQLGPISAGQPFADMIASDTIPVTRLDRVFRFAEGG